MADGVVIFVDAAEGVRLQHIIYTVKHNFIAHHVIFSVCLCSGHAQHGALDQACSAGAPCNHSLHQQDRSPHSRTQTSSHRRLLQAPTHRWWSQWFAKVGTKHRLIFQSHVLALLYCIWLVVACTLRIRTICRCHPSPETSVSRLPSIASHSLFSASRDSTPIRSVGSTKTSSQNDSGVTSTSAEKREFPLTFHSTSPQKLQFH